MAMSSEEELNQATMAIRSEEEPNQAIMAMRSEEEPNQVTMVMRSEERTKPSHNGDEKKKESNKRCTRTRFPRRYHSSETSPVNLALCALAYNTCEISCSKQKLLKEEKENLL
jgi:hypothetical protein